MSRRCELTDKRHQVGHNISHSHRKTKRRFQVNLRNVTLHSELLGRGISLRIAASTLRSVDHNGGIDQFLLTTSSRKLTAEAIKLKKQLQKALSEKKAA